METLIDTCVLVDYFRPKTSSSARALAHEVIIRPQAVLCEPVKLEFLRGVGAGHLPRLTRFLATMPVLPTPADFWVQALRHARACSEGGFVPGSLDILIATVAIHHRVAIATFDRDFQTLARHIDLRVELLG